MDIQYSSKVNTQTVRSPHEQNLPGSDTERSREEARIPCYGMKTEKFSPDSDALQLSPHLAPHPERTRGENTRELPARKPEISHHQSALTENSGSTSTHQGVKGDMSSAVKEASTTAPRTYIARAEEQIERLRLLLQKPMLASLPSVNREYRTDQTQSTQFRPPPPLSHLNHWQHPRTFPIPRMKSD
ncbi:hypothetical protein [Endozoicomonas sp. ONNA2]|uniref:hypothetical protein n=1 Tax=Endozoicomonas sp. ONNA2 TaxID=2828741 RepID=UPI00214883D3|nr:hypothetical protein [Endozoicomonas sp. ONNA2]